MDHSDRKVKILVLAPYIGLVKLFQEAVRKRGNIELTAYESDTTDAVPFIKTLPFKEFDIIISRGYTCKMIQAACERHVLDVGISIYDVLRAIRLAQNYNGRFAVVGFHSIIYYAIVLKDVLQYEIDIFTVKATEEIGDELRRLKALGYTMIVGDVITTRTAKSIGLQTILITTSPESVDSVLDNSLSLYEEQLSLKRERDFYKELVCGTDAASAVYGEAGNRLFSNPLDGVPECEELERRFLPLIHSVLDKGEIRFVKTVGTVRFLVHAKAVRSFERLGDREQEAAAFFYKGMDRVKKDSGLLTFPDQEDGPPISQRIFYTLSPDLETALLAVRSFQFFSRPVIIEGPHGSGKDSFAFYFYQSSGCQNNPMAVIDCSCAGEKEWESLLNDQASPLYGVGYTLYFKDLQLLNERQQGELLALLQDAAVNKRNQLIFSYVPGCSPSFSQCALKHEIINILQALTIHIPSLNERKEDIPNLATLYLSEFNSQMAKQAIAFEPGALKALQEFDWTDNLYQLRRVIQELILCSDSTFITEKEVKDCLKKSGEKADSEQAEKRLSLDGTLDDITKRVIRQVLAEENMNQSRAAKRLGIGRSTLRRHLDSERM